MGKDGQVLYKVKDYMMVDGQGEFEGQKVLGGEIEMNITQLLAKFPMKNDPLEGTFVTGAESTEKRGAADGIKGDYDFNVEEEKLDILKNVSTKEDFQAISENRIDGLDVGNSFAEALYDDITLQLHVIQPMFTDKEGNANGLAQVFAMLDKNNDNKIDSIDGDMATEFPEQFKANLKRLVNAIAFVNNENFDLEVSRELLATYYANHRKDLYDRNYKHGHKKGSLAVTLSPSAVAIIPGYDKKTKGREVRINYQNFQEGSTITHYNNIDTYEKNDDGWLKKIPEWDDNTNSASTTNFETIQMTDEEVAEELGFLKYKVDLSYDPTQPRPTGLTAEQYAQGQ